MTGKYIRNADLNKSNEIYQPTPELDKRIQLEKNKPIIMMQFKTAIFVGTGKRNWQNLPTVFSAALRQYWLGTEQF